MAAVVDEQNATDPSYQPMVVDGEATGHAFDAAWKLVADGVSEPSGYTEPRLHGSRRTQKIIKPAIR
mgnify:FL=1